MTHLHIRIPSFEAEGSSIDQDLVPHTDCVPSGFFDQNHRKRPFDIDVVYPVTALFQLMPKPVCNITIKSLEIRGIFFMVRVQ